MITVVVLVIMAMLATGIGIRLARGQRLSEEYAQRPDVLTQVDMDAFRNLIDSDDETYLRSVLAPAVFRRLQKQRLQAIAAYVRCIASNAAILLRLGELARRSSDPEIAGAGQQLAAGALRLRLSAFLVLVRLRTEIWIPGAAIVRIGSAYEQLGALRGHLAHLQNSGIPNLAVRP
jgi:hypothetical protein